MFRSARLGETDFEQAPAKVLVLELGRHAPEGAAHSSTRPPPSQQTL